MAHEEGFPVPSPEPFPSGIPDAGAAERERKPGPVSIAGWVLFFAGNFVLATLPFVGFLTGEKRFLPQPGMLDEPSAVALAIASSWLAFFVAAGLAWRARLTRSDLGLTVPDARTVVRWTAYTLVALLAVWSLTALFGANLKVVEPITHPPRGAGHWLLWIGLALTAGTTEEFVMRGYGIGFWVRRGANRWPIAAAMSLLFGGLHLYQGPHAVLVLSVWGFLFALAYLRTGSILPGILAHAIVDGVAPFFV